MVQVAAASGAKTIWIAGHGLLFEKRTKIAEGIWVSPDVPKLSEADLTNGCVSDHDRFAITSMREFATFSVEVFHPSGGKPLANKAWNTLWLFHLLSLSCGSPAFSLFSTSHGDNPALAVANRNIILNPLDQLKPVSPQQVAWAAANYEKFSALVPDPQFSSSMRYFGNAHYLFDLDARIMLLWAGIEGILNVDAEHGRRIGLYSALMLERTAEEKVEYARRVTKAYGLRSRVVHGSKPKPQELQAGYQDATEFLARLLSKCVALGRVPTRQEYDALAASHTVK